MKKPIVVDAIAFLLFAALSGGRTSEPSNFNNRLTGPICSADLLQSRAQHRPVRLQMERAFSWSSAQVPPNWAWAIGRNRMDEARGVLPIDDGGCLFWGATDLGHSCAWISELSADGEIEWSRAYPDGEFFTSVKKTRDGGVIAAGQYSGTSADALLMKLRINGDVVWSRAYDTGMGEFADCVQQTKDGGFIIAGPTTLFSNEVDWGDFWAAKVSLTGEIEWSYVYRGTQTEGDFGEAIRSVDILQAPDGGYVLAGDSKSFGAGWTDIWILKLTSSGSIEWQKAYGGKESEWFNNSGPHILLTSDKGYLVACSSLSFGANYTDGWLFKLSSEGEIEWQKLIGGTREDRINSIQPTTDGKYVLAGGSQSFSSDNFLRAWLLKIDSRGNIAWERTYGNRSRFEAQGVQQALDDGFVIGGYRTSSVRAWYWDSDRDAFIMKVWATGEVGPPGSDFMGGSNATVKITDADPIDTNVAPLPCPLVSYIPVITPREVSPYSELLSWNLNLPPLDVSLKREINRGLFKGEGINTISWSENPWNTRFNITEYRIYRKIADLSDPYQEIGRVSNGTFVYVDGNLSLDDRFAYVLTSVDEDGHESAPSAAVHNE